MQLSSIALAIVGLSATVAADYIAVVDSATDDRAPTGIFVGGFGSYAVDASDGCRSNTGVPGMNTLCFGWSGFNRRGHFIFDGQAKRCFRMLDELGVSTNPGLPNGYLLSQWAELACYW
ncbi:hypothetical protein C8A01DRAFT_20748 [Parachaetomium inaequale]|uniref:Uncharacterized protein n=1 Tax=Parachaetomium inaequale TaxID=2588326 RepID=A0AAN6SM34_9PEZI|nr:hypothetical protein C8A01DRAFT_20748 [Parachaetomium inaequale]